MIRKGISLVGIKDIADVMAIRSAYPDCWFEISYLSTPESLKEILPVVSGRVASIHMLAPVREFFPNLSSDKSYAWSEREILKDAGFALSIGAENLVLHPGYLVDGLVYRDYSRRLKQLHELDMDGLMLVPEESVCSPSYIESSIYRNAFDSMVSNAQRLSRRIRELGLHLCLENLNPRAGYLFLHPDEAVALASEGLELCIDVGHLQVNSAVFGFDVLSETKRILDTGHVRTMHLHSNGSKPGFYKDSHESLDKFMPFYKEILKYGQEKGANLILETLEEPLHNISLLF